MSGTDQGLKRVLGPFDATCVVAGAIIGVGIFFTPSQVAGTVGSADLALWTWAVGGVIALLGALTFAGLGALYTRTGGQYEVLRDAYGPAVGFTYVLCISTAVTSGAIAIIAIVCVDNAAVALYGRALDPVANSVLAAVLVAGIALANAMGVLWGSRIQNFTVVAKLATLITVVCVAAFYQAPPDGVAAAAQASPAAPESSSWLALVCAGLVPVLFSFGGWQQALWMGGEVVRPGRNVPLAIMVGVSIVVVVYLLANWAYLALLGHAEVAATKTVAADAVEIAWGDVGRSGIGAAVALSALGVLNAQLLAGPRLVLALARDGRFFAPFSRVHASRGTPVFAIVLMAGLALVLIAVAGEKGVSKLTNGVVLVDTVFFAMTGLAPLVLVRRRGREGARIRIPGYPIVPLLFVAAEVGVAIGAYLNPDVRGAAVIGAVWIAVALALYLWRFRRPARA